MNSHELAKILLASPDMEVTVSVDIGSDDDPFSRVYGVDLYDAQIEPDNTVTLIFEGGCMNDETNQY